MKKLLVYPTSRALREVAEIYKQDDTLMPTLMRMDEFESRSIVLPNAILVDPLQRILLLQEASSFNSFRELKVDRNLVKFFTKSDAIFKFFEELAHEGVAFEKLREADAYVEFDKHITILEELFERYSLLLKERGLTDRMLLPITHQLNRGFIDGYELIEIYIEGYLSHYELGLIDEISRIKPLIIHYATSKFNHKMTQKLQEYDIVLPRDSLVSFDFHKKEILTAIPNELTIDALVLQVEERYEQISVAFTQIERLVRLGISPDKIALLLPDESVKESFALYDHHHNLNFAMGFDYKRERAFKQIEALYNYWQRYDKESRYLLERYGMNMEKISQMNASEEITIIDFFTLLESFKLLDCKLDFGEGLPLDGDIGNQAVFEKAQYFIRIFDKRKLSLKEWLFFWHKALSKITIDDVRGGKITVMGLLETRGVSCDAVVIVDFNEGTIPTIPSKDQFLNSSVREFASLPTLADREALQKQLYKRVLEQAQHAVILYSTSGDRLPSKFLYELGLPKAQRVSAQLSMFYSEPTQLIEMIDPIVDDFDASKIVWSASRLKTYLECKRKYYYRYICKLQAPKDEQINEGSLLHALLERLYCEVDYYSNTTQMQQNIAKEFANLLPYNDARSDFYKLLWGEKLSNYIHREVEHFANGWRVVAKEHEVTGEIAGLKFKGRIDRIDQNSTDTLVIDYKTGSIKEANKSKNLETLVDFQMSIYHYLLYTKYQNLSLGFLQIFEDRDIEYINKLEDKNDLLLEHISTIQETKSFTASKCEELHRCKYCEFTLLCERGDYL